MPRHAQGHGGYGAKAGSGVADWQALEVQLNRTRVLLQEILVHLQEVLKNLRTARNGSGATAGRTEAAGARFTATRDSRFRTQAAPPPPGGGERFSRTETAGAAGTAAAGSFERNRFKARPHGEAKGPTVGAGAAGSAQASAGAKARAAGNGQGAAAEDKTRTAQAGPGRTGQSTFRAHAGHTGTHRERPRPEAAFRARTAGAETDAGARSAGQQAGQTPGADSAGQKSRATPGGGNGFTAGASNRSGAASGATSGAGGTRASAQGATAGASRPQARPRPERAAQGFRPDRDRQHRAREMARKSGMNLKCAYDILCLDYPCSVDEIKNAYRHMARMHHPDLGGDEEAMKDVNVAYELAMRFSAGRRTAASWAV
jgi:hypothetical protein